MAVVHAYLKVDMAGFLTEDIVAELGLRGYEVFPPPPGREDSIKELGIDLYNAFDGRCPNLIEPLAKKIAERLTGQLLA